MTRNTAKSPGMLRFRPPRIAISLLLGAAAVQVFLLPAAIAVPSLPAVGLALGVLGASIMLRAWWLFKQHETAICPTAAATALITGDVYRLTRNPMYLGIVLMLLGIALASGGPAFYIAPLLFFLIIDTVYCPFEEDALRHAFGERYAAYAGQVRRWL
jgi:protein-S-isoprenylcysteine O-methyltransferase Ste14